MPNKSHISENKANKKHKLKNSPTLAPKQSSEPFPTPTTASDQPNLQAQAASLSDPRIPLLQRQMMADQIGEAHGNLHLQRVVESPASAQRSQPPQQEDGFTQEDLKPGDILLQVKTVLEADWTQRAIMYGQFRENLGRSMMGMTDGVAPGSPLSVHAAMYIGDGKIAEAVAPRAHIVPIPPRETYRVYRCTHETLAQAAAEVIKKWATNTQIEFDHVGAARSIAKFAYVDNEVRDRMRLYARHANTIGGPFETEGGETEPIDMFCSKLVIASYQAAAVNLAGGRVENIPESLQVDDEAVSPYYLEELIRRDIMEAQERMTSLWEFMGEIETRRRR
ncbi:MAG: hypothetical protein KJ077_20165 [Anaerolineae bacterium]|nr:hypothetical protein [Anaerolineae bacterium]